MKINSLFYKENYIRTKCIISFIISIILAYILEIKIFDNLYNFVFLDRICMVTLILFFMSLHLIYKLDIIYEFIYKKRYYIAIVIFMLLVVLNYSGSSIMKFNGYIQPNSMQRDSYTVLGKERSIRSDEWATNTPLIFSQIYNNFNYFTDIVRGTTTDMYTVINAPVLDILIIGKPFNIGYILFGNAAGLSFWWYGRLIALLLVSFELCMIITNKNKLFSLCGMFVISLSPAVQWWYSNFIVDILIYGQFAILCINSILSTDKFKIKILSISGLIISALGYIFTFYPPWQVPFAYVFLALFIWIVIKNKDKYKINLKDNIIIFVSLLIVVLICFRYYELSKETLRLILNSDYPGERFELGGGKLSNIFTYIFGFLLPYKQVLNPCELSNMLSFYPLPSMLSIVYIIRNKKVAKEKLKFIIPMILVTIFLSIWVIFKTNHTFAKLTFLYLAQPSRLLLALGLSQIYLLIYLLANIKNEDKMFGKKSKMISSVLFSISIIFIAKSIIPSNYLNIKIIAIIFIVLSVITYLMFNLNKEKSKKILVFSLIAISIISGIDVNPIIKGVDIIYDKPISKKLAQLQNENEIWITDNLNMVYSNYLVANGIKVLNSTNYYKNQILWDKVLVEESLIENNRIAYNRYAHLNIVLTNSETSIKILYADNIELSLNIDKLEKLKIKYILSNRDLSTFNNDNIKFENIYDEDGCIIFKVIYKEEKQ